MKIKEIMSKDACYLPSDATLQQAAQKMLELDCGFIPVGKGEKLCGIVTDRDIATRGTAKGLAPTAKVTEVMSEKVLYCFQDQETQEVAENMADNQVRRLIVLTNPTDKKLCGVVSVCDIVTANKTQADAAGELIKCVSKQSSKNNQSTAAKTKAA